MKIDKSTKQLLFIAAIFAVIIYIIRRKNNQSNFAFGNPAFQGAGGQDGVIVYQVKNNTDSYQTVNLFQRISTGDAISVVPSKAQFAEEIKTHPVRVTRFRIRSSNVNQVETPLVVACSRSTGASGSYPLTPSVSPTQVNPNVVDIVPPELILDGTCSLMYRVAPQTQVNITVSFTPDAQKHMTQLAAEQASGQNEYVEENKTVPQQKRLMIPPANASKGKSGLGSWGVLALVIAAYFVMSKK